MYSELSLLICTVDSPWLYVQWTLPGYMYSGLSLVICTVNSTWLYVQWTLLVYLLIYLQHVKKCVNRCKLTLGFHFLLEILSVQFDFGLSGVMKY